MNSIGMSKKFLRMKFVLPTVVILGVLLAMVGVVSASVIGGGTIIAPPADIQDSDVLTGAATNFEQEAFDERQNVLLTVPLAVDVGFISKGMIVDSHMIFLNQPDGTPGVTVDVDRTWTFDKPIVGVMSDSDGTLEVASTPLLGAPGTVYPGAPFGARGMEGGDGYVVSGSTIEVTMRVSQPGDWIRVITSHKTTICHKGKTITVSNNAVPAHLDHGDALGPCLLIN